jgi:hypothetical protein
MVALQGQVIRAVPLLDAVHDLKRVAPDADLLVAGRQLGISFGD